MILQRNTQALAVLGQLKFALAGFTIATILATGLPLPTRASVPDHTESSAQRPPNAPAEDPEANEWLYRADDLFGASQFVLAAEAYQHALEKLHSPQEEELQAQVVLRIAGCLISAGRYSQAQPFSDRALRYYTDHPHIKDRYAAIVHITAAAVLRSAGSIVEALSHQQQGAAAYSALFGAEDGRTLMELERVGEMQLEAKQYEEARKTFERIDDVVLAKDRQQPPFLPAYSSFGDMRYRLGLEFLQSGTELDKAYSVLINAYEYLQHMDPSTRPADDSRLGVTLNRLSALAYWRMDFESAKRFAQLAIDTNQKTPHGEAEAALSMQLLGTASLDLGEIAEAGPLLEKAVALQTKYAGLDNSQTALARLYRAQYYQNTYQPQKAIPELRAVIPLIEPVPGQERNVDLALRLLARSLADDDELQEAYAVAQRAVKVALPSNNTQSIAAADALEVLGYVEQKEDRLPEAERTLRKAYDMCRAVCKPESVVALQSKAVELGYLLSRLNRTHEARDLLAHAVTALQAMPHPDADKLADARAGLADAEMCLGDYSAAEGYASAAYMSRHKDDPHGTNTVLSGMQLATVWARLGRKSQAESLLQDVDSDIGQFKHAEKYREYASLLRAFLQTGQPLPTRLPQYPN